MQRSRQDDRAGRGRLTVCEVPHSDGVVHSSCAHAAEPNPCFRGAGSLSDAFLYAFRSSCWLAVDATPRKSYAERGSLSLPNSRAPARSAFRRHVFVPPLASPLQYHRHGRIGSIGVPSSGGAAFHTFAVIRLQHVHGAPCTFGRLSTVGRPVAWPVLTYGIEDRRGKRLTEARSGS